MFSKPFENLVILASGLVVNQFVDNAMNYQIGVTSDRAGEMAIVRHVECIVPFELRLINSFGRKRPAKAF